MIFISLDHFQFHSLLKKLPIFYLVGSAAATPTGLANPAPSAPATRTPNAPAMGYADPIPVNVTVILDGLVIPVKLLIFSFLLIVTKIKFALENERSISI